MHVLALPLHVRPLVHADLSTLSWAGTPTHLEHVSEALRRALSGEVVYLAVCGPADLPLSIGAVDFAPTRGSGYIWQVVTHPALRSGGLGTLLASALEETARARGCTVVELGVEDGNPRALALYERLGYVPLSRDLSAWTVEDEQGRRYPYSTWCTMLRKELPSS